MDMPCCKLIYEWADIGFINTFGLKKFVLKSIYKN